MCGDGERQRQQRGYATPAEPTGDIQAASPIRFTNDAEQFSRPRARFIDDNNDSTTTSLRRQNGHGTPRRENNDDPTTLLRQVRIVPASPSYFTATPQYTDDLLKLSHLLRKHQLLPVLSPGSAPRVAWKTIDQYKTELAEPIRSKGYNTLLQLLKRLNYIHPSLMPTEVAEALEGFKRDIQPYLNTPKPIQISPYGISRAVGRRKSSSAVVQLVEGTGEVLINSLPLPSYFPRLHDRESAIWALKSTQRLDKYNVFALASGGGTTGQAEAITLACAKALLAHEPDLKPALRRAGCVTRDPRRVERKKPGKLKARKMPAWVKR
ncbi:37S ribosomal protein S9, mitochondrial [Recurvomyces mirabilis]|uniref:Small ribosomal subunit protein uS9m n=1 Tax=Recurvomyces mirabilis TaxID=574656 RepID=A0AAE0TQQ8_9PEZI|nr:37S ribosomal protein S9, mitochondrial [Recurvomyces mirabilis]KAK5160955.1 37S ribosomal protein S9, mitochondrial [Recurvomyces mirabilis]